MTEGLDVEDLTVEYPAAGGRHLRGADAVSLSVRSGERLGVVGESGSGKSTTALGILRLVPPPGRIAGGRVVLNGVDLAALHGEALRAARLRLMSYIPQGAMSSLNPVSRIAAQLREAMEDHDFPGDRRSAQRMIADALESVDLPARTAKLFPHELSGGMKQRVCIAIGMLLRPQLIIADEPTSALDVVTQRQVMATLGRLQRDAGSSLILIGHDMGLMAQFVDRLAVMYAGRIVECGAVQQMFRDPRHPYTRLLVESVPSLALRGQFVGIPGTVPSLADLPAGCSFAPRCPRVMDICRTTRPKLAAIAADRVVACHLETSADVPAG